MYVTDTDAILGARQELTHLFHEVAKELLTKLRVVPNRDLALQRTSGRKWIWWQESGMPEFVDTRWEDSPIDYGASLFGRDSVSDADASPQVHRFCTYVLSTPLLNGRVIPNWISNPEGDEPKTADGIPFSTILLHGVLHQFINTLVHTQFGSLEYQPQTVDALAELWLNGLLGPKLNLDICVPLLFVLADFDRLDGDAAIERIEDDFHIARAPKTRHGPGVHSSVYSCATHMLVLRNRFIRAGGREVFTALDEPGQYPLEEIDVYITALRAVAGIDTGYAQVLARPSGWASEFSILPTLLGSSIRKYPYRFENFHWLRKDLPSLTKEQAQRAIELAEAWMAIDKPALGLALRRLQFCFLRDDDEDRVVDAAIGLEALLSDNSSGEMTHKLALRIAALSQFSQRLEMSPSQVFKAVKGVYGFRSSIVHGGQRHLKSREIRVKELPPLQVPSLAVELLVMVLEVVADRPEFTDASTIDDVLLLGSNR